jgi:4'-phosphopantetheinyl transferase
MLGGEGDPARVDVVQARPRAAADLERLLGAAERDRLARLRREADRAGYATAHALLRLVAAAWTGQAPDALVLGATCLTCGGPHGKPHLEGGDPAVHVSLSRAAGQVVVVAVTRLGPIGVDAEVESAVDFDGFDAVALAPGEQRAVADLPDDRRSSGRAVLWARKEAVLKATGHGLMAAPSDVEVSAPFAPPELLAWRVDPSGVGPVHLANLALGEGLAGAVAVVGGVAPHIRLVDGSSLLDGA